MFVPGRHFQPTVIDVSEVRSPPWSGAPERYFTRLRPYYIRLGWKVLLVANTEAYYKHYVNYGRKRFISMGPGLVPTIGLKHQ